MFFVYNIPNYNPALGAAKDGKQAVSVYDRDLGNRRTVITTPEEADAFIKERKEAIKEAEKKGIVDGVLITTGAAAVSGGINAVIERNNANKLNKIIDQLNPEFRQAFESANAEHLKKFGKELESTISIRHNILSKDAYKPFSFKLLDLFSAEQKAFNKVNITKAMKKAGLNGAIIGGVFGLLVGIFTPEFRAEKVDRKLTSNFIENNKFEEVQSKKTAEVENDEE